MYTVRLVAAARESASKRFSRSGRPKMSVMWMRALDVVVEFEEGEGEMYVSTGGMVKSS
jgi:hypothetical protein